MDKLGEDKRYYKISEVAEMLGLETSTLRYWEGEFTILSPRRGNKGNRLYTDEDIENARMVQYLLKQRNLTIKGAQKVLEEDKDHVKRVFETIKRLEGIREEVRNLKCEFGTALKKTITIEEL
ncbi:MAG: MerR family transcriptional regulator [Paludibacteraceae bacterium]|nr:MerR family transcriptional regulator [Paludibacteraceae bacterium]